VYTRLIRQASRLDEHKQARLIHNKKYESPLKILARIIFQPVMVASVIQRSGCIYTPSYISFPFRTSDFIKVGTQSHWINFSASGNTLLLPMVLGRLIRD
jgi:hypothetical protein